MKLSSVATLLLTGTVVGIIATKLFASEKKSKASKKLRQKAKKYKKMLGDKPSKKASVTNAAKQNIKTSGVTGNRL